MELKGEVMRKLSILLGILSPFRYKAVKCGHITKRTGKVSAFGYATVTKMPLNKRWGVDWCLKCLGKMAIRCAWCGNPIFIGDPVTLYVPRKNYKIPDHATAYRRGSFLRLVGCLGRDCAMTGADRAGFWLPGKNGKGQVYRIASPLEIAIATGKCVLVRDISSQQEATDIFNNSREAHRRN